MLYVIPTPIGNKDDITLRALHLLQTLPVLICENTHTTKKLMQLHNIPTDNKEYIKFTSHDHPHIQKIIDRLKNDDAGLVSECGTPGLSDPGKMLIIACHAAHIPYTVLPGATALIPAVVGAPHHTTQWLFAGFLPHKKGRETSLKEMMHAAYPTFFYESVHRIEKCVEQLIALGFDGHLSVSREVSKHFEQSVYDHISQIKLFLDNGHIPIKGEFVVGVYPADPKND